MRYLDGNISGVFIAFRILLDPDRQFYLSMQRFSQNFETAELLASAPVRSLRNNFSLAYLSNVKIFIDEGGFAALVQRARSGILPQHILESYSFIVFRVGSNSFASFG